MTAALLLLSALCYRAPEPGTVDMWRNFQREPRPTESAVAVAVFLAAGAERAWWTPEHAVDLAALAAALVRDGAGVPAWADPRSPGVLVARDGPTTIRWRVVREDGRPLWEPPMYLETCLQVLPSRPVEGVLAPEESTYDER